MPDRIEFGAGTSFNNCNGVGAVMLSRMVCLSTVTALLSLSLPAFAAESVYTDVDLDHCQTLDKPAPGEPGDYISMKCKGYRDYPLYFKEGDLRQSVFYGFLDKQIIDEASESFGPFNHIGKKVEWRLDGRGKPYAAILRFHIENSNPESGMPDKQSAGQVLVVSRVGQPDDPRGCVAGYVDALANPDPNERARQVADDLAPGFACGKDEPAFHGIKGDKSGETSRYFPAIDAQ
jgi:hypothetical protein